MNPKIVQPIILSHVLQGRDTICTIHIAAPKSGTNGTSGVLNGRFRSGCVLRSITIDIQTIVNAINVPIDTSSLSTCNGNRPAINPVTILANMVAL